MKGVSITVFGKVQGVGFRFYTKKKADELNLTGWVKNMRDGSVYIEAEGENQDVDTFIDWCRQGPEWAQVIKSQIQMLPLQGFTQFTIR
ncbi:MAG: acylphosphatase [Bacteroidales bacterium]|jgi:acylphosphatase|nr:acylphosphatase [Bacteroidota bacterium]MCF8348229.1 acylphosphatase [Bacteroidales bacterium]